MLARSVTGVRARPDFALDSVTKNVTDVDGLISALQPLSYEHVNEIVAERGVEVDASCVCRLGAGHRHRS
jgi:hypothetical protein